MLPQEEKLLLTSPEEGQLRLDDRRPLEQQQPGRGKQLPEERHEESHVHEVLAVRRMGVYA